MAVCAEIGVPHPVTVQNVDSIEKVFDSGLQFPIVVKPCVGYGAIGFKKVDDESELRALFANGEQFENYVFQEYIPQTDIQYECAMFMDDNDEVRTSVVFSKNRWFPIEGGSSTFNVTVDRPDIVESCTKLLKAIHWRGAADIDLIQDPRDGKAKIMEINPRVSGSVKICFEAGVNQAQQMKELACGENVTKFKSYKLDQRLRCSQTDLLWLLKSPNRFKSTPSWFSIKNTKDQIFYLKDPIPYFVFSLHGLFSYKDEMIKRKGKNNNYEKNEADY
jgi:predicted ATP-grasp superfamily ATP-dependent carboligase